jgi:hypothetical protein
MDPASIPAKKKWTVAYTMLHTINYDGSIPNETFVHELVHVWQYRREGSLYISESIWAQKWGGGYNYGGIAELQQKQMKGLSAFNFEQQGEIVEDYYRLKNNLPLQWSANEPGLEELLNSYIQKLSI